jgi:hypothetical protein
MKIVEKKNKLLSDVFESPLVSRSTLDTCVYAVSHTPSARPDSSVNAIFFSPVTNDVHQHTGRRLHDHEVPVKLTDLSHIGQHVPATADAGRRDRHH